MISSIFAGTFHYLPCLSAVSVIENLASSLDEVFSHSTLKLAERNALADIRISLNSTCVKLITDLNALFCPFYSKE